MFAPFNRIAEEVARLGGLIHLPIKNRTLSFDDGEAIRSLPDGAVVLGHSNWYLCNVMIPGFWKHAAIKSGDRMIEAISRGVVVTPIGAWVSMRDAACALTPTWATPEGMRQVAAEADKQVGKPYDFDFAIDTRAFYCAELVWWAYKTVFPEMGFELRERMGRLTVTPEDFFLATKWWNVKVKIPIPPEA